MQSADSDKQPDQPKEETEDRRTKYFRTLVKSGYQGKLVESGESADFVDEVVGGEEATSKEATEVSEDIKVKALHLLGFVEEYFVRPESEGQELCELSALANEDDLAALLNKLEKGHETTGDEEPVAVKDSIKRQIQLLLATKGVKEYFFGLLKQEVEYFKIAQPTLKRVELLQRVRERIVLGITKFYLRDKRSKGKLMATTAETIQRLEEKRIEAEQEERQKRASADEQTQSWLMVQELLQYKEQLKKKGFAKTESRRKLIEQVQNEVVKGNRVFLVGSTGTGKTQLAMIVAELVNECGFELVTWTARTTARDIFGYREVKANGNGPESYFNPGPMMIAIEEGKIVIHDEITLGSTDSHMSVNALISELERGQEDVHIPGLHGKVVKRKGSFGDISTGNPKDERTKKREEMDPAVLRRYVGIKVPYMPALEMKKVILAELIDDTGYLPFSPNEMKFIDKLTQAAELMQMCHDREVGKLKGSKYEDSIKQIFGGKVEEVHLDKSFLDTGTIVRIFKGWDLERARGQRFEVFLKNQLAQFIDDPKFDMDKEERKLARTILEACGVMRRVPKGADTSQRPYILPSEIGSLFNEVIDEDILGEGTEEDGDDDSEVEDLDEKLENLVNNQYEGAINLLQASGLYNPSENTHPSKTRVKKLLASNVNREQLEVIGKMENPVLQIVPNHTMAEYETALNSNKPMVNRSNQLQIDAHVSDWMKQAFGRADTRDHAETGKITGWKIAITEGSNAPALLEGDDTGKTLEERCTWFENEFKTKGISGIDIKSYMLLMMAGFLKEPPRPVDDAQGTDKTWTMLNAEEIFANFVAGGVWNASYRRVHLDGNLTDAQDDDARFRASVMVDVPSS